MKNDYFKLEFLWKTGCAFLLEENTWKLSEINTLNLEKRQVSFILLIRKRGVKVVNRDSLHGGSLEITRSPPLIYFSERVGAGGELWSYVCVQSVYSYQIVESQVDVLYSPVFSFFSILQLLTKNQKQNFLIKTIFIL